MPSQLEIRTIAHHLIDSYDNAVTMPTITSGCPGFDNGAAYNVLAEIAARRRQQGWTPAGRKIGFTNRSIWPLYGVDAPMWAHMWDRTVHYAVGGRASLSLRPFVQPRIEPEVVFKLRAPIPDTNDPVAVLSCVEWFAPGFEIVQCHFPDWQFSLADCTAAFGLHGALVVGTPVLADDTDLVALAATLQTFEVALSCDGSVVDHGVGANVLGSPALALAHLGRVVANQPKFGPPATGEVVTTGTITDARPIVPGQTWTSDYGRLGVTRLELELT